MDRGDSSSDEERYTHNINVPTVNLALLRKNKKNNAKTNLAKAKQRFGQKGRAVHFPDSNTNRYSVISNSSTANALLALTDEGSDLDVFGSSAALEGSSKGLPNFSFAPPMNDPHDSESSGSDVEPIGNYDPVNLYNEDSSDDERASNRSPEVDIADIRRTPTSQSGRLSDSGLRKNALKGIFRRMSLADSARDDPLAPSRSDTFLGRVLSMGGGGISSGGLVPGASHRTDEAIDEEKAVGTEDVEMRNLDFADLNEEAQKLISAHVPELRSQQQNWDKHSVNEETANSIEEEKEAARRDLNPGDEQRFYQPNPDLLNQDLDLDLQDDDYFDENDSYVAPPKQVHAGVLLSLLKLYQHQQAGKSLTTLGSSGMTTLAEEQYSGDGYDLKNASTHDFNHLKTSLKSGPKKLAKLYQHGRQKSTTTSPRDSDDEDGNENLDGDAAKLPLFQNAKPKVPRMEHKGRQRLGKKFKKRQEQKLKITVHIADILQRQRFIIRMCRALMLFGAPTHRLEEYMVMTSRVLEIDGQFVYFPGTMIVAFGDAATRTSEVHLVRCAQGLNLSKLADTHKIYKDVIHDLTGVEGASQKLEELLRSKNRYSPWICVFLYALGSAAVCTFGFDGGWVDIPISFGLGLIIGYLQFFLSSKSHLYSSVFEVTASIVVSFAARGIGSIKDGNLFCFGAIAQGSLALILPGYIILCGSLELQSKNLVAGSVRMFYAIIYSLFLGFGITLGAALYGWVDKNATNEATCASGHSIDDKWRILFVPMFSLCLGLINQARWSQTPIMTLITAVSYTGTFFAGKHFSLVTEFTSAIGAFIIGVMGNMYSRIGKGMAVSAMLPAIFVQVPSGIASKSTLLAGVSTANQITNSSSSSSSSSTDLSSLSFGATMVEVSIGISVGLFAAALVVYPFGKKRTGLFSL